MVDSAASIAADGARLACSRLASELDSDCWATQNHLLCRLSRRHLHRCDSKPQACALRSRRSQCANSHRKTPHCKRTRWATRLTCLGCDGEAHAVAQDYKTRRNVSHYSFQAALPLGTECAAPFALRQTVTGYRYGGCTLCGDRLMPHGDPCTVHHRRLLQLQFSKYSHMAQSPAPGGKWSRVQDFLGGSTR